MERSNNSGFSLLEIMLASVIFVVTVAGIFATLNAVRVTPVNKESALAAAVFGKQILEALRSQVNDVGTANYYACGSTNGDGSCGDFGLAIGKHEVGHANLPAGITWPTTLIASNTSCDASGCLVYTVSCADGSASPCTNSTIAHRVDLNIQYTDET